RAVLRTEHQHLVDAAGGRLHEDGATMLDGHRLVAGERGIAVGHHSHLPLAVGRVALERRRLLVARAERAAALRVGLHRKRSWREVVWPLGPLQHDRYPPARERIEAQLT